MPRVAHRLVTPPASMYSIRKPSGCRRDAMIWQQPASSGVLDRCATSARVRSRTGCGSAFTLTRLPSDIAQQLVDPHLAARLFVHALHDHGAIEAVAAAVLGQRTGDHDAVGRNAPVRDLAGLTVVDRRGLA